MLSVRSIDFVNEYRDMPWTNKLDQLHLDDIAVLAGPAGEAYIDSFEVYERR